MKHLAKKKVLITGAAGFIGSNLALKLIDCDCEIHCIDGLLSGTGANLFNLNGISAKIELVITKLEELENLIPFVEDVDYIFHFAGQSNHSGSMQDPINDLDSNSRLTLQLLEAVRLSGSSAKFVFSSTRQIYGRPKYLPVDELHPLQPVDVNGINKISAELYFKLYADIYKIRSVCLRLTNVFGPRMRIADAKQNFLGIWIRAAIEDGNITIFGDGSQIRDFLYIDDCLDVMSQDFFGTDELFEVFNLGGPEPYSLMDIAKQIRSLSPNISLNLADFPPQRLSIDIGDYFTCNDKINSRFNLTKRTDFLTGLNSTLDYYRENYQHYLEV